jgi:hypothetical protein
MGERDVEATNKILSPGSYALSHQRDEQNRRTASGHLALFCAPNLDRNIQAVDFQAVAVDKQIGYSSVVGQSFDVKNAVER